MADHWQCWRTGMRMTSSPSMDLLAVVKRGSTFAPVTSGVEQSFAKIDERLGQNRLNASSHVEDRNINLILAKLNETQLDDVLNRALAIWKQCFHASSRVHTQVRSNKNVMLSSGSKSRADPNSEKSFLKRIHSSIASKANPNSADLNLVDASGDKPTTWSESHEAELEFQTNKRSKKMVEAHLKGHLLPEEHTDELRDTSSIESARQAASYRQRVRAREQLKNKMTAVLPTAAEMNATRMFLDDGLAWNPQWIQRLHALGGLTASFAHLGSFFISKVPRNPNSVVVSLVAAMRGSWVISPEVFLGKPGPSVKFVCALQTKRYIWASPNFRSTFANEWRVILEVLSSDSHRWKILPTAMEWATAKVTADAKKRSAEVVALIGPLDEHVKHSYLADEFFKFIANTDSLKGSIGLLDM